VSCPEATRWCARKWPSVAKVPAPVFLPECTHPGGALNPHPPTQTRSCSRAGDPPPSFLGAQVWWTGAGWCAHACVAWLLLRLMALPPGATGGLPWAELFAYAGYVFVPACWTLLAGMLAGEWACGAGACLTIWLENRPMCSWGLLARPVRCEDEERTAARAHVFDCEL
jgi:hypothetical protein